MTTSRYFDTMLTLFDERSKSEVELKDFVDPRSSSSHVFTILKSTIFFTKFSFFVVFLQGTGALCVEIGFYADIS